MTDPARVERNRINLLWLVRLRWGAALGQIATVAVAAGILGIDLPLATLIGWIALEAGSNLIASLWLRRAAPVREEVLVGLMALDVIILTGLLRVSGGPFNPFSTLYLVNIALAAVILRPLWTWALVTFSLVCFGALFLSPPEEGGVAEHLGHGGDANLWLHLEGMWVAFGAGAAFIVYFVQRVTGELARLERDLEEARRARVRAEQLGSLATLAAGAAHELATPLATIAVVARELERSLGAVAAQADAASDARLIREQVDRCREILDQMAIEAGEAPGEPFVDVSMRDLLEAATRTLANASRVQVVVDPEAAGSTLHVPQRALAQALRALTKNALEAAADGSPVLLRGGMDPGAWCIEITDRGVGMSPAELARLGEPFYTTKGPGAGMGLGVFLARAVLERLGGRLEHFSPSGRGTTARIVLPRKQRVSADDDTQRRRPSAEAAA